MKILVCGGREYANQQFLYDFLDGVRFDEHAAGRRVSVLIHGDARGADKLAHGWAITHGIQPVRCPALWDIHGPKAGAIRNRAMLELSPDLVIGFPGGKGTAHMVGLAKAAQVRIILAPM